jgi:2-polyprenyl-3-methyl-5-hydroxy-6-metoxy-1,4-benzoquinol methylase
MNDDYIRINKDAFDKLCSEYGKRIESKFGDSPEKLGGLLLKHVNQDFKKVTLLEVGPGSGHTLKYFSINTYQTIAIDLSEKMAKLAKENSPASIVICDNILDVHFLDAQFEAIFAGAVIHLFPLTDARILLHKFSNWLKPNGYLFINTTIHHQSEEGFFIKNDYPKSVIRFRRKWMEQDIICEIINANFEVREKIYTNEIDRNKKWIGLILQKKKT